MYLPKYAQHETPELIQGLMNDYPFATLITHENEPFANHLPFLLETYVGPNGTLISHMARNNPQWRHLESGQTALIVFQGPHSYISPSIYVTQPNVPTWNYAAVHAYGKAKVFHDEKRIEEILAKTVAQFEGSRARPWKYQLPVDYRERLIKAIVGFEIEIERIEGKFKLSQNRTPEDYAAVVTEFSNLEDKNSRDLVKLMALTKLK